MGVVSHLFIFSFSDGEDTLPDDGDGELLIEAARPCDQGYVDSRFALSMKNGFFLTSLYLVSLAAMLRPSFHPNDGRKVTSVMTVGQRSNKPSLYNGIVNKCMSL